VSNIRKKVYARASTIEDVNYLQYRLRNDDIREVFAQSGISIGYSLELSYNLSEKVYTGMYTTMPFCMFGVARNNLLSDTGSLWLLATEDIKKRDVYITFLKESKTYIKELQKDFKTLTNYVHSDNIVSIKWLKWLGAEFEEPQKMGFAQEYFVKFTLNPFLSKSDRYVLA